MSGGDIVVLRSFGKFFGLAGIRLGFALAAPPVAARITAILGPWAVSGPALAIGTKTLADAEQLSLGTREMVRSDGAEDGCFVTYCAPNELLWLNTNSTPVKKGAITLPPHSIVSQKLGWNQSAHVLLRAAEIAKTR